MIVSDRHRYTYLAIPKTGSKSTCYLLVNHYAGIQKGAYHQNRFEKPGPDWLIWSVVRNPYARLVSYFWFECRSRAAARGAEYRDFWLERGFADFLRHLIRHVEGEDIPDRAQCQYRYPQHRFLEASAVDRVLRLERIGEELKTLPFVDEPLPSYPRIQNPSERWSYRDGGRTWLSYYDEETLDLANRYGAAEEALAFGYQPLDRVPGDPADAAGYEAPRAAVAWSAGRLHRERPEQAGAEPGGGP